jgi:hypothetical protein
MRPMIAIYNIAKDEHIATLTTFLRMINDLGTIATAKRLVHDAKLSDGI